MLGMASKKIPKKKEVVPIPEEDDDHDEHDCICLRPTRSVFCQNCGAIFKGRCRKQCLKHPRTIYLMDNDFCAKCKIAALVEV